MKECADYINEENALFKPEYIVCAAIYVDIEQKFVHQPSNIAHGFVVCGLRHCNCYNAPIHAGFGKSKLHEIGSLKDGFLTSKNRFVDRKEAAVIALSAKQIKAPVEVLCSEDIY